MATFGNISNITVFVLNPVGTGFLWTGQRIMIFDIGIVKWCAT
jgi:hypothetical protein